MKKPTPRPRDDRGADDAVRATPKAAATADPAARRRQTLRDLMAEDDLTVTSLARLAGLPSGNAIFNFLHGHSASLSQTTIEAILRARPHWSPERLLGRAAEAKAARLRLPKSGAALPVLGTLTVGTWGPRPPRQPPGDPRPIPAEQLRALIGDLVADFVAVVGNAGAELLYAPGTVLVCRRFDPNVPPRDGQRVVVQRERDGSAELTVWEAESYQGTDWLWPRSLAPDNQQPARLPAGARHALLGDEKLIVLGTVIATWVVEAPWTSS